MSASMPMPNPVGTPTGLVHYAAFALYIWDYLLTFEQERDFIWRLKWSLGKILFLIVRYLTLFLVVLDVYFATVSGVSDTVCARYTIISRILGLFIMVPTQIILQLRIYLLYERRKVVLFVNTCVMFLEIGTMLAISARDYGKTTELFAPEWVIGSCYSNYPESIVQIFIPPLLFDIYLTSLVVIKVIREHKLAGLAHPVNGQSILSVLARDSVVFSCLIALAMGSNIIAFITSPVLPGFASCGIAIAAGSIGAARLVFSMRDATSNSAPCNWRNENDMESFSAARVGTEMNFWERRESVEESDEVDPQFTALDVRYATMASERNVRGASRDLEQ